MEAEVCADHIHMLEEIPPKIAVSGFRGYLNGKSGTRLYGQFDELKYKYRSSACGARLPAGPACPQFLDRAVHAWFGSSLFAGTLLLRKRCASFGTEVKDIEKTSETAPPTGKRGQK